MAEKLEKAMPEPRLRKDREPFSAPLIHSKVLLDQDYGDYEVKLRQLENDPRYVIRKESLKDLVDEFLDLRTRRDDLSYRFDFLGGEASILKEEREIQMEAARRSVALWRELKDEYKIPVSVEFVIGGDRKGKPVFYSIVDKIEGERLPDVNPLGLHTAEREIILNEFESISESIIAYFIDKFRSGEPYFNDCMSLRQFMFGRRSSDEIPHIYLVDVDNYIADTKKGALVSLGLYVGELMLFANKFGGVRFEKPRRMAEDFLRSLNKSLSAHDKEDFKQPIYGLFDSLGLDAAELED